MYRLTSLFALRTQRCAAAMVVGLLVGASGSVPARAEVTLSADLGVSARQDEFTWNIADSDGNPNVLSELTWRDVQTNEVVVNVEAEERRVMFLGRVSYGDIGGGELQDSDYNRNDRQGEFSRSSSAASGDNREAEALFGYRLGTDAWSFIPLLGYSVQAQNLQITDGRSIIPATGNIDGLNSSYDTRWKSWIAGVDVRHSWREKWRGAVQLHRLWADYEAEADWNLVDDFAHPLSFRQTDRGDGYRIEAHIERRMSRHWGVALGYAYQTLATDDGVDTAFYANGTFETTALNGVDWTYRRVMIALTGSFN